MRRIDGLHFSTLGLILGFILFELWLKTTKGVW